MNSTTNKHRGAPAKPVKWPKVPYTLALLASVNAEANSQSKGALYNKVKKGAIIPLVPTAAIKGKGRKPELFVMKEYFVSGTHQVLVKVAKVNPEVDAIAVRLRAATPVLTSATFTADDFKG
jgi:hypothetical protein